MRIQIYGSPKLAYLRYLNADADCSHIGRIVVWAMIKRGNPARIKFEMCAPHAAIDCARFPRNLRVSPRNPQVPNMAPFFLDNRGWRLIRFRVKLRAPGRAMETAPKMAHTPPRLECKWTMRQWICRPRFPWISGEILSAARVSEFPPSCYLTAAGDRLNFR